MPYDSEFQNRKKREDLEKNHTYIKALGYKLVHMRECTWQSTKTMDNLRQKCLDIHKKYFPDTRYLVMFDSYSWDMI